MKRSKTTGTDFTFKGKTITLSREADADQKFQDKLEAAAAKVYRDCGNVVSGYARGALVKATQRVDKDLKPSAPEKVKALADAVLKAIPAFALKAKAQDTASEKKYAAEKAAQKAVFEKKTRALIKTNPLPDFLRAEDLLTPDDKDEVSYEKKEAFFSVSDMGWTQNPLYFVTGWGWCLPVLRIKSGRRVGQTDRAYAIRLSDGAQVRVGLGPHVTAQATLHLKKSNYARLMKSLKPMLDEGAVKANQTRDELSTRRMAARGRSRWSF